MTDRDVDALTLSARNALGSAEAFDVRHYLIAFIPSSILVLVQESGTLLGDPLAIAVSAVSQHLAAGIVLPVAFLLTRRGKTVPLGVCFLIWAATGVLRAAVGATVAVSAGAAADLLPRIVFWVAVLCLWAPVTAYAFAQFERRRRLLGILHHEQTELVLLRADERSRDAVRAEIVDAITARVLPVVADIRAGLSRAGQNDPALLGRIGERLARVADEVDDAVRRLSVAPLTPPLRLDVPPASPGEAMVLLRRNPLIEAVLAAVAQLAVLLPLVVAAGPRVMAAITVGVIAGHVLVVLLRWALLARRGRRRALIPMAASLLLSGTLASGVALLILGPAVAAEHAVLLLAMPPLFAYGSGVIMYAGGSGTGNRAIAETLLQVEQLRAERDREVEDDERGLRDELEALTHGPIQGRLAACAMALNFYAADHASTGAADGAEGVSATADSRTTALTDSVIRHLDAVSVDLHELQRAGR